MGVSKDINDKGREKVYLDIDRIINEGLAGGTVNNRYKHPEIDEARPLKEETLPRKKGSN